MRLPKLGIPPHSFILISLVFLGLSASGLLAQPPQGQPGAQAQPGAQLNPVRPDYVLGAEDQIIIRTAQVPEINDRPFRIDPEGFIELPIIGRIKAAGLTVRAFETDLVTKLREFVVSPQVFITLAQLRGDPVFFVGSFRTPGIYPLSGRRTLVEMLTTVGGLLPNASRQIKITRRLEYGTVPLPNSVSSPDKRISTVEINMESLSESVNPEEDIVLQPYDIISAERAEKVYVTGEVTKSASIELGERTSISITQALTEVGGLTPTAKRGKVRVLRLISGTNRRAEIVIDAKQIFEGKARDFPLQPNDVLYVPWTLTGQAVLTAAVPGMISSIPYLLITLATRQ